MKKICFVLSALFFLSLVSCALDRPGNSTSDRCNPETTSEQITASAKDSAASTIISLSVLPKTQSVKVGQTRTDCGYILVRHEHDDSTFLEDIFFEIDNESIATISFSKQVLDDFIYYSITGISPGETTAYARNTDGTVSSEKITITVTGKKKNTEPPAPPETKPESTIEPVTKPVTEPVTEPITEPITEPVTAPVTEPVTEPTLEVVLLTSPVSRNETATLRICGKPDTEYTITVYYKSGASTADGLEPKYSDANGFAEWSWKIGGKTSLGTYRIVVREKGQKDSTITASITIT